MPGVNPLNHPICFAHPSRIAMSAWMGHVPFGMYIMDLLRPKAFAELGTHFGVSYCAFCQAAKALDLDTRGYAIDTWQGDEQAGFYGSEVLTSLEEHHNPAYGSFSQLIQSTFDEALGYFATNSLDLLHIDGYHTYEAVKADFEKWLPKMTDRGVILFHDINVRERDFGVWRFWEEVKLQYPHFEFAHSHGLGVLAVGQDYPEELKTLLQSSEAEASSVRRLFSNLGARLEAVQELQSVRTEVAAFKTQIENMNAETDSLKAYLQESTESISSLNSQLQERNDVITEKGYELIALNAQLVTATKQREELERRSTEQEVLIHDKDLKLNSAINRAEEIQHDLQTQAQQITELQRDLKDTDDKVQQHQHELQARTREVSEQAQQIEEQAQKLAAHAQQIPEQAEQITEQAEQITEQAQQITEQAQQITEQAQQITEQAQQITRLRRELKDKEVKLQAAAAQIRSGERRTQELAHLLAGMEDIRHTGSYRLVRALSAPLRWKYRMTLRRLINQWSNRSTDNRPISKSPVSEQLPVSETTTTTQVIENKPVQTTESLIWELFDAEWYLRENPHVATAKVDPFTHYLSQGAKLGRSPNPFFDPEYYLTTYPEAAIGGQANALEHYLTEGWKKGNKPSPKFDPCFYLARYPDIAKAGVEPLTHFVATGRKEGRSACLADVEMGVLFDAEWYLRENPDVAKANIDPIAHYLRQGVSEGRAPNPLFDPKFYLKTYPEAAIGGGADPLHHYLTEGWKKGYRPNPRFDPTFYLAMYPDIAAGEFEPLTHFATDGLREGRAGCLEDVYLEPFEAEFQIPHEPITDGSTFESDVKAIAFYLPQFHPIPENDQWWGPGFTEWTNVRAGEPQYKDHYQPHVPYDLEYYDLRETRVLERQVAMAQEYGIYGFCLYYYWFAGKILLDLPLRRMLERGEPDFPFCICWANENWTRRWDGLDNDILIGQQHSPEDDLAFMRSIESVLLHKNYIKVDGKPLLIVYQPSILPDALATATRWRKAFRSRGHGEIFLAATQTFDYRIPPSEYGFDAVIQFPPHTKSAPINGLAQGLNKSFAGHIYDYNHTKWSFIEEFQRLSSSRRIYPGVMPSWDNTARRRKKSSIWINSSPESYYDWLSQATKSLRSTLPHQQKFVFINAWNEWAEGCHLEPDQTFGYAWLNATRLALQSEGTSNR